MLSKLKLFFQNRPAWVMHLSIVLVLAIAGLGIGAALAAKIRQPDTITDTNTQQLTENTDQTNNTIDLPETEVKSASPSPKTTPTPTQPATPFQWGVTLRPEPSGDAAANRAFLPTQFEAMKDLGITTVRVDYNTKDAALNDRVLELAKQHNMSVIFIIPFGPNDIWTDKKLADNSYNYVLNIVKKYKNDVKIWQLGTEVASVALKSGGHHGVDRVDYPEEKYKPVATWLMSATKAVKDADPTAKRMLNDQWVHVGFFDRFIKEGGNFEILGWNWFSDMGDNMDKPTLDSKTGQTYKLMDKLKSYKKELWISEINRRRGDADGNSKAQADYITKLGDYAAKNSAIKGFLVFHLLGEEGYGLIAYDHSTKSIANQKPAYAAYKALIKKYKK